MNETALREAITLFGSQKALADAIGVPRQAINYAVNHAKRLTYKMALHIAQACFKKNPRAGITIERLLDEQLPLRVTFQSMRMDENNLFLSELSLKSLGVCSSKNHFDKKQFQRLKDDIEANGLNHPVLYTQEYELISGAKRVCVMHALGHKTIPAKIISMDAILSGQYCTSEIKKSFLISERVMLGNILKMRLGHRQGCRVDVQPVQHAAQVRGKTRSFVAKVLGFGSHFSFGQGEKILLDGIGELIELVDMKKISLRKAANIACLTTREQRNKLKRSIEKYHGSIFIYSWRAMR